MRDKTVDPNVHDLAALWLMPDACGEKKVDRKAHDARVQSLAQAIQGAIEDWQDDEARAAEELAAHEAEELSLKGYSDAERDRI